MRKTVVLIALLLLVLIACAETGEPVPPTVEPAARTIAPTVTPSSIAKEEVFDIEPTTLTPTRTPSLPPSPSATLQPTHTPIPPATSTPIATPYTAAESPWPRFLRRLDFGIPTGNSYAPRDLAVHSDRGWLYARTQTRKPGTLETDAVTVLDASSGQVQSIAELGSRSYSEGTLDLDVIRDRLYATNPADQACAVLDALTLESITTLEGVQLLALDVEAGHIYVAGPDGLDLLDASAYGRLLQAPLPASEELLALSVDPSAKRTYLTYRSEGDYTLGLYDAASLESLSTVSLPGRPAEMLPDPERGRLYLTLNDGESNLLWILDQEGHLLEEQQFGRWTDRTYLALDFDGDRLFLGREVYGDYGITIIDLRTNQETADIPLADSPHGLVWDEETGRLLVSHTYADQISAVDPQAGQVSSIFPTAIDLEDLALDPDRNHVYLTDSLGRLHVLDGDSDGELALLPAEGQITVDSPHGRFYTGGQGAATVRIFDSDRLQQTGEIHTGALPVADAFHGTLYLVDQGIYLASLETLTITDVISDTLPQSPGFSPNPAAIGAMVDPGSGRVFGIINNGVPGSNNGNYLYVYEPETYEKTLTDSERSPIYLDVDPNTGRAYISRIHLAGRSTSLLADGREYTARLDGVFGALGVDPALDRVYLTVTGDRQHQMFLLDASNLHALSCLPITGTLLALNPQRHLLYLATDSSRVEIWSATGGALPPPEEPAPADLTAEEIYNRFLPPGEGPLFATDSSLRLYRSDDNGTSWMRIRGGLPDEWVVDLIFSPDFVLDETLWAAVSTADQGFGVWRSTDGGWTWQMSSEGLTDLAVTGLLLSPTFAEDQTLFAQARRGGLLRSTDAGQSWVSLTNRYRPSSVSMDPPGTVSFSPTYDQDRTLYINHYGLQRSTDGGDTWTRVFPRSVYRLAFSPEFAADQTLFGWSDSGGVLHSVDGGDTWRAASAGLTLQGYGSERLLVSPDFGTSQTLYFGWTPSSDELAPWWFRSTDAATTWEKLVGEPPPASASLEMTADGVAFVAGDETSELVLWPVADMDWQATAPSPDEVVVEHLALSPGFARDQTLLALSSKAGILRSGDAGLTWTETGFPIRATFSLPEEIVFASPHGPFIGTPLGLYRLESGGTWTLVGGGLPTGSTISSPEIGADDSLRVMVGGEARYDNLRVYLSTDGGQTWRQTTPDLPYYVDAEDVHLSPAFATDLLALASPPGRMPLRSIGGGEWQEIGPPGGWTWAYVYVAPGHDQSGLLFVTVDDASLWRSTNGGDTWVSLAPPWEGESLRAIEFSPAFAQDGVLLAWVGTDLYRSTDQGDSWLKVLELDRREPLFYYSPGYARDGQVYLIQNGILYASTDRGQTWKAASQTPWDATQWIGLALSPAFPQDHTLVAWLSPGQVYRSTDSGQSWRDISQGLPQEDIQEVLFSPAYATDEMLYLVPRDGGLYKQVGESAWLPVTERVVPPTPKPPPTPTPPPAPTTMPVECPTEPRPFPTIWEQPERRARLGCPQQPAQQVQMAEQPFEYGTMIWDSITRQIYVLLESGTWEAFEDTWIPGQPEIDPALVPPEGRIQPQRGFGKVWRDRQGGPEAAIGWAVDDERTVTGWKQRFERGWLVWTDAIPAGAAQAGTAYLLYDDGTWQAAPAPPP